MTITKCYITADNKAMAYMYERIYQQIKLLFCFLGVLLLKFPYLKPTNCSCPNSNTEIPT